MISGYNDHTLNYRDCEFTSAESPKKRKTKLQHPSKSLNYTNTRDFEKDNNICINSRKKTKASEKDDLGKNAVGNPILGFSRRLCCFFATADHDDVFPSPL